MAATPCTVGRSTLSGAVLVDLAGLLVVVEDVECAVVGAEVVAVGHVGMRLRNCVELRIAPVLRRPFEQFQIHHVIDDNEEVLLFPDLAPATNESKFLVIPFRESLCAIQQDTLVLRFRREAQGVAHARHQHEPDVVVAGVVADLVLDCGELLGGSFQVFRLRELVEVPKRTGEEAAAPVLRLYRHELVILPPLGKAVLLPFHLFHETAILFRRAREDRGQLRLQRGLVSGFRRRLRKERGSYQKCKCHQFLHESFSVCCCQKVYRQMALSVNRFP